MRVEPHDRLVILLSFIVIICRYAGKFYVTIQQFYLKLGNYWVIIGYYGL